MNLRRLNKLFPLVRAELTEFQVLLTRLERAERLALKGKLDGKALRAIYMAMPRGLVHRRVRSATEKQFIPNTLDMLVELNRVIKKEEPQKQPRARQGTS